MGFPKTTLKFSESEEGLTELGRAVILRFMIHYSERVWVEISKS